MNIAPVVLNQVILMAVFILLGFILTKVKMFSQSGSKQMSDLLLYFVTPCVIINSIKNGYNEILMMSIAVSAAAAAIYHIAAILFAKLLYIKKKNSGHAVIDRFCTVYSNCGFMGIPLLQAVSEATGMNVALSGSVFLVVFNVFVWTQGYSMFKSEGEKLSVKKVLLNPGVIGLVLAFLLVITKISLPGPIDAAIEGMSLLNTPVAMLLLGIYLAETDLVKAVKRARIYLVCALRLVIVPLLVILVFKFIPVDMNISLAVVISSSCPCATISAIFAAQANKNSGYASSIVALSTVFSLATIPLMTHLAALILNASA